MRHILMLYVSLNEASVTEDFSCRGHFSFQTKRVSKTLLPFNDKNNLKEVSQTDFVLLCPISASRCWTRLHRKLIQIQNRKKLADDRTDRRTDILYFHSGDLTTWPATASAARNYGLCALMAKKRHGCPDREKERKRERRRDG